jgi:ribosome production factor 2
MADASKTTKRDEKALSAAMARPPKTRKGRQIAKLREPQVFEEPKQALVIRGGKASHDVCALLRDLAGLRYPLSTLFMRSHPEHPFEDTKRIEKLCNQRDHSLFVFGSSSKKRPFRVIFGRMFNSELLDMQEFNVTDFKPCEKFSTAKRDVVAGSKPLLIFQGAAFDTDEGLKRSKSLLLDYFEGATPDKVLLQGLDQVIVCSTYDEVPGKASSSSAKAGPTIIVRRFRVILSKSGTKAPRCELEEIGPRFSLGLDRTKEPNKDAWKNALKVPKQAAPSKVKNISTDSLGKKRGRIHLGKQDFNQIHTVHHGLSKKRKLREELKSAKSAQ